MRTTKTRKDSAAKDFAHDPRILEHVARDLDLLGYAGEEATKKMVWLCACSRLLTDPWAVRLISPAGSGKSHLVKTVLQTLPFDSYREFSRITEQALYRMAEGEQSDLQHRLVTVAENEGSREADYPLRSLISEKRLELVTTIGGRSRTFIVQGPIAYIETGTRMRGNAETSSRLITLHLETGTDQTRFIQQAIARKYMMVQKVDSSAIIGRHHAFQKGLVAGTFVTIPFADRIAFPAHTELARREFAKFLSVIASVTLVHGKLRKQATRSGQLVLTATDEDYELARELAGWAIEKQMSGTLSDSEAAVLIELRAMARQNGDSVIVTRAQINRCMGASSRTTDRALQRLEERNIIERISGSNGRRYEYLFRLETDPGAISIRPQIMDRRRRRTS